MNELILSNNAAKQAVVDAAVSGGDLSVFAATIRGDRYSCPTSLEFGDKDLDFHGRRINALAANHEADRSSLMYRVGLLSRKAQKTYGPEIAQLRAQRQGLQALATTYGDAVRRIDAVIGVMKDELARREAARAEHTAAVEAARAAKAAQATTVIVVTPAKTPEFKFSKRPRHIEAQCRGEQTYKSFEDLKKYQENTELLLKKE
jgi:hypothetical protein